MRSNGMDSNHSWIVAIAGSFVFLLTTWPVKVGGQLFVAILDNIETDRNKASFPFTLAFSIRNLSGPFVGLFATRYGLQAVTVTGCVFCAVGVGGCYFAEDIGLIAACLGVIYGTGFGLSTLVVPEIMHYHFDQHGTKALGVVFGGSALGAFLTPPLFESMLLNYRFSGALLIMSAIILNSAAFAMLLSAPKRKHTQVHKTVEIELTKGIRNHKNACPDSTNEKPKLVIKTAQSVDLFVENNSKADKKLKLTKCCQPCTISDRSTFVLLKVLWSPSFLVITVIQSLHLFLQYTTWTITVDIARDKGIKEHQEAYFVMGVSLFEVIGLFTLSTINDCRWLAVTHYCAVYFAIIGFTCLVITWVHGFLATMISICFLASMNGGNASALPGIVAEFIPEEERAMAMASRFIMYAPLSFIMSPLIGYFRGSLGSYNGLLYVMTSAGGISTMLLIILPWIYNCGKRRTPSKCLNSF